MTTAVAERVRPDWDYLSEPKEDVRACNLCGMTKFAVISTHDRAGYPAPCCICLYCGLGFLSQRMTAAAYAEFYRSGTYRQVVEFVSGTKRDHEFREKGAYAGLIAEFCAPFIPKDASTLLDIGGADGVVAYTFKAKYGVDAVVLDPSGEPCAVPSIPFTLEGCEVLRKHDVVLMCQTVDHLMDLSGGLAKARSLVAENGLFYVDIVDFLASVRLTKKIRANVKLDHPYYLTEETFRSALLIAGFQIERTLYLPDKRHVGYACKPIAPQQLALGYVRMTGEPLVQKIREASLG